MVNNNTPIPHCEHSLLSPEAGVGEHMDLEGCTWSIRKGDLEGAPGVEGRYRFARVTSLLQNGSYLIRLYCQTIFSVRVWPFGLPPLAHGKRIAWGVEGGFPGLWEETVVRTEFPKGVISPGWGQASLSFSASFCFS